MSTTEITPSAAHPVEKISLARSHLITLTFFLAVLVAQYVLFLKYTSYIPEQIRDLTYALAITLYAVQSGFMVCVIPLGVVFIFGWLYLINIEVDIRKLYQIVAVSIVPLIVLMLGSIVYTLLFVKIDAATSQRLTELSAVLLQDIKQNPTNSPSLTEWTKLLEAQRKSYAASMDYLFSIAAALSCLLCGLLLHKRVKLAAWKALLIPATFAGSVVLIRNLTATSASHLMERLQKMIQP